MYIYYDIELIKEKLIYFYFLYNHVLSKKLYKEIKIFVKSFNKTM